MKTFFLNIYNSIFCFFKEIYLRLKLDTPTFLKKIRKICLYLGGVCTLLASNGIDFDIHGISITKYGAALNFFGAFISSLGVCNPDELHQKMCE